MKKIAILGSTGSIGTQTLEVVAKNPNLFKVDLLTAGNNVTLLAEQAYAFQPKTVVIANKSKYTELKHAINNSAIEILAGEDAITEAVAASDAEIAVTAMVGFAGLQPTVAAIKSGKDIALANKETLVVAGDLITQLAKAYKRKILPVDSEHSAIFQCLTGEFQNKIEKIYLTASGGPFRGKTVDFLKTVTKQQALKHPNWDMGAKITIDSASLMNKGLEAIEAKWLFDLQAEQIDIIVHPQSIVHSIVQFTDGSMKAQMGLPDMKLPIQYALTYPNRIETDFPRFNFANYGNLTFEKPDTQVFRNLDLAFKAMKIGGNMPCIMNAANEAAVYAFLRDEIGFLKMTDLIEEVMNTIEFVENPTIADYLVFNKEAFDLANRLIATKAFNR